MQKKNLQDLKNKSDKDLQKIVSEKTFEIAKLKSEIALARQKNVRLAKIARTELSRAKTLLVERKMKGVQTA